MRKTFLLSMILLMAILLSSCDPGHYHFKMSEYMDQIDRIELVKYTNDNYEIVDPSKEDLKFDLSKAETVEVLDKEKHEAFLEEFERIIFHDENESVNEPTGYCLLWYLKNGNIMVFSCTLIEGDRAYSVAAEFDSNGNFVKHHANFASGPHYDRIMEEYFESYTQQY